MRDLTLRPWLSHCRPAVGCFMAGTLVHTKEGLKPIEQIKVGDWVLSRPEEPVQGTETGYKRVSKTFRFENKEVVRFWWERSGNVNADMANWDNAYVTPNHPVWLNPNGWVAMGRLYEPGKQRPGTIDRGGEWSGRELVLADGSAGGMLDVMDLFRTDRSEIAFGEEDDPDWGYLVDFSGPAPTFSSSELAYDYEKWGNPSDGTRKRYTATVYNLEVEDWHTYFVGKTGLWVHNTNCVDQLIDGVLRYSSAQTGQSFNKLTQAELNEFLRSNPNTPVRASATRRSGPSIGRA